MEVVGNLTKEGCRRKARRIMSEHLGRKLSIFEIIHHIDKNPRNNNINNLQLMTAEEHGSIHGGNKKNYPKDCKRNRISKEKIIEILELYRLGLNYSQISRRLGISDETIRRYILNNNKMLVRNCTD